MFSDALSSIGISLEEIRREAGDAFEIRIPDDRRIPFSPQAKRVLGQSLREAVRLRDNRIGTEHILLGMLRKEDRSAVRLLDRMGVTPEVLEARIFESRGGRAAG